MPNRSVPVRGARRLDVRDGRVFNEALKWSRMVPGGAHKKRLYDLVTPDDTIASRLPSASFTMLS